MLVASMIFIIENNLETAASLPCKKYTVGSSASQQLLVLSDDRCLPLARVCFLPIAFFTLRLNNHQHKLQL
jgi:hypothetical protein